MLYLLAGIVFAAQVLTSGRYGYFRDEFYYFACGEHLDWGYVDQPPLVALVAYLVRHTLGESLLAIRLLPAACNAAVVFFTGSIARQLGGGRFAQVLAALCAMFAPVILTICHYFSMNCFDHLFWAVLIFLIVKIVKEDRPILWVPFGIIAGLGLMNKYSVGFLGMGLVVGLLLTSARKHLYSEWIWLGGALAGLIFLPHILWQVRHGFPTAEFIHNATVQKNAPLSPLAFMAETALQVGPITLPIWLAGLYFFFRAPQGKCVRLLGWVYVSLLGLFLVTNGKPYYLAPSYYALFAAGAVQVESRIRVGNRAWLKTAISAAVVAISLVPLPIALPVLPVETFARFQDTLGLHPDSGERGPKGKLFQQYADMFGWQEQVAAVSRVYNSLSPEEKARAIIFCDNYGEAGAIDFLGKKYGLPHAASVHNNYWYWGPGNWDADIIISLGVDREDLAAGFEDVQEAAVVVSEYARPFETNLPIYVARRPRKSLREVWPMAKKFI